MSYNEGQSIAIAHNQGPMLVLAGPGSGKTHVITNRIGKLIDDYKVNPENILVITFTKYAANEMKERFYKNYKTNVPVTFGTFHGIFYGILKWKYNIQGSSILSDNDKYKMVSEIIVMDEIDYQVDIELDDEKEFIQGIIKEISKIKGEGILIDDYESTECPPSVFRMIYKLYEERRRRIKGIDFDDMIIQCYELLSKNEDVRKLWQDKFQYILIDEFQDINQMQFETIQLMATPRNNLFVVGDDDQSIYSFRGAKPEIMLNFKKVFPDYKEVILRTNYRSTTTIVEGASRVIQNNKQRYDKELKAHNGTGDPIHIQEVLDQTQECQYILKEINALIQEGKSYSQMGIIYRTNLDARAFAAKLVEYNIPFSMKEHLPNIFEHFISKNILAYMHLSQGNMKRQFLLEIINRPNRFMSRQSLDNKEISFESLRRFHKGKEWMIDRVDQLELDLRVMKNLTPFAFIEYLRKSVGYNDYLKEYAQYKKIKVEGLLEILDEIQEQTKAFKRVEDWVEYLKVYKQELENANKEIDTDADVIKLHTMHGSKGLEFDYVFMIQCNEGITPSKKAQLEPEIEEERRMFYVAMTRAKKKLTIVFVKEKHGKDMDPSRFISELLLN